MTAHVVADIDADFVPTLRSDLAVTSVGDELVYALQLDDAYFNNFDAHWLDASATTIWRGLDGERSVGELANLIATAFDLDTSVTLADTLEMVRSFGRAGALVDVTPERPKPILPLRPEAIEKGTTLPPFATVDLAGTPVDRDALVGAPTLLVHWSPTCTYCRTIAVDLVDLAPQLTAIGAQVVMFTLEQEGERSVELLSEVGLDVLVLRNPGYPPFDDLGTPSGYLLDAGWRVDSDLAIGSNELGGLARYLLGTTG